MIDFGEAATLQLRMGQPDAVDASHFTIGYLLDGRPYVIDGWLRDDDTVDLKLRDRVAGCLALDGQFQEP